MKRKLQVNLILNGTYDELNPIDKILLRLFANYSYKLYSMGFKSGFEWKEK